MRGAPIPPAKYDGEHLDTDEKLEEAGWAAGLDVWEQVGKGYSEWYLNDDTLGNAQLWSLRQAIRAELMEELATGSWVVPKITHDENAAVGPRIRREGWISRAAGDSDPEHTRQYAAQLLAAADEADRRASEGHPE